MLRREKVVFRRQSDVFPVKNEGFPAKSVTKRSLPGTKRGLSSWADGQKRCFPGECPMIDNLPKIREKHTLPGSQSAGARTISAETARYALASRGISAFRSGIHVPGLFCVVRGRITRFSRFRGLGSAYDHGQKEVYSASLPEPLLQMQAGHPIYCGRRQNEVYLGCEVDSKGGGQRLKEQGFIRWG